MNATETRYFTGWQARLAEKHGLPAPEIYLRVEPAPCCIAEAVSSFVEYVNETWSNESQRRVILTTALKAIAHMSSGGSFEDVKAVLQRIADNGPAKGI